MAEVTHKLQISAKNIYHSEKFDGTYCKAQFLLVLELNVQFYVLIELLYLIKVEIHFLKHETADY